MSITLATFHEDDLVTDPGSVAEALNHSCFGREIRKTIQAVCQIGQAIYFVLRHTAATEGGSAAGYHIVELTDTSHRGFVGAVNAHAQGSMDIVGTVTARGGTFAVFRNIRADA